MNLNKENQLTDYIIRTNCEAKFGHKNFEMLNELDIRRLGNDLFRLGFEPSASTNIADQINYGYGELDEHGFWQIPVSILLITLNQVKNLKEPKEKILIHCLVLGQREQERKYLLRRDPRNVYASDVSGGQRHYTTENEGLHGEPIIDTIEWFCCDHCTNPPAPVFECRDFETFKNILRSMQITEIFKIQKDEEVNEDAI